MREHNVYHGVLFPIKPKCDPELAEAIRKYLISYYAGNMDAEMTRDELVRSVLFSLSGESLIFIRKLYGKESDQMNWVWKFVLVILSLNCVPRLCTTHGDAAPEEIPCGRKERRSLHRQGR